MAITYIGAGTAASVTTILAQVDVAYPAGITANDTIVLAVSTGASSAPTAPTGFVSRASGLSAGSGPGFLLATRVATGSESGTVTVAAGGATGRWQGRMFLFRGVDTTTPADATGTTFSGSSTAAFNLPTLTTTTTGVALVAFGAALSSTVTWTPPTVPATFTEVWDAVPTTNLSNGLEYLIWAGSGATGTVNLVTSAVPTRGGAGLIALRPAAGAPPPKTGTATGTYAWAGTATGVKPTIPAKTGTAVGGFAWNRTTATGSRTPKATGTGTYAWNRTAGTGSKPTKATAAGAWTWHGIATGLAPAVGMKAGTATGTYLWARTTATGYVTRRGTSSTGTYTWNRTAATGQAPALIGYVTDFLGHLTHAWHSGTRYPIQAFLTNPPGVPVNLTTIIYADAIQLDWDAPVTGGTIANYQVRKDGGTSVPVGGDHYVFTGLTVNTSYLLEVRAVGPGGTSAWVGVTATTVSAYAAAVLADSPLAYYRLGEASGAIVDSSGNGRNGTVTGTVTRAAAGLLAGDTDGCIDFPSSGNNYGVVADGAWIDSVRGFECVIRPDTVSGKRMIHDRDPEDSRAWQFYVDAGQLVILWWDASSGPWGLGSGATLLSSGTTYHVGAMLDGAGTWRLYLNGAVVATSSSGNSLRATDGRIILGGHVVWFSGIKSDHFDGRIDEVAFYGTGLSTARMLAHYNATL